MRREHGAMRDGPGDEHFVELLGIGRQAIEQTVARRSESDVGPFRPQSAAGRALRNDTEGDGFVAGEAGRSFREIDFTGRAGAFDVAAIRREIQIRFEDLRLAVMAFQLERAPHLRALSA